MTDWNLDKVLQITAVISHSQQLLGLKVNTVAKIMIFGITIGLISVTLWMLTYYSETVILHLGNGTWALEMNYHGFHLLHMRFVVQKTLSDQLCNLQFQSSVFQRVQWNAMVLARKFCRIPIYKTLIIMNIKEMEKESSCKGKRKHQPSECMNGKFFLGHGQLQQFADEKLLSAVMSNQPHSSQLFPQHYWRSDSSGYASTFGPQVQLDYSLLPDQLQSMQTTSNANSGTEYNPSSSCIVPNNATSCIPQIMERFPDPLSKPSSATPEFTNEQDVSACITPIQNEHIFQQWIGDGSGDITSTKLPKNVTNSSIIQETSCLTYGYSDDALLKASSFQHLQGVVDQLNVGTKLCIRDSLYRLARNVVERHIFPNNTNDSGEGGIQKRAQGSESEKRCTESVDVETHTNPIDRSVAHLLFHRPLELAARSADAVLLGSLLIK